MTTRVVNVRTAPDGSYVYVGRPMRNHPNPDIAAGSIWGNPFQVGRDGTVEEVLAKYRARIMASPGLLHRLHELRGQALGCWCHPRPCHADVLAELADGPLGLAESNG